MEASIAEGNRVVRKQVYAKGKETETINAELHADHLVSTCYFALRALRKPGKLVNCASRAFLF